MTGLVGSRALVWAITVLFANSKARVQQQRGAAQPPLPRLSVPPPPRQSCFSFSRQCFHEIKRISVTTWLLRRLEKSRVEAHQAQAHGVVPAAQKLKGQLSLRTTLKRAMGSLWTTPGMCSWGPVPQQAEAGCFWGSPEWGRGVKIGIVKALLLPWHCRRVVEHPEEWNSRVLLMHLHLPETVCWPSQSCLWAIQSLNLFRNKTEGAAGTQSSDTKQLSSTNWRALCSEWKASYFRALL